MVQTLPMGLAPVDIWAEVRVAGRHQTAKTKPLTPQPCPWYVYEAKCEGRLSILTTFQIPTPGGAHVAWQSETAFTNQTPQRLRELSKRKS